MMSGSSSPPDPGLMVFYGTAWTGMAQQHRKLVEAVPHDESQQHTGRGGTAEAVAAVQRGRASATGIHRGRDDECVRLVTASG